VVHPVYATLIASLIGTISFIEKTYQYSARACVGLEKMQESIEINNMLKFILISKEISQNVT
jgi:hypothetical protein